MEDQDEVRFESEVERLLDLPAFKRAPVQSRLLQYLARCTRSGISKTLTQEDIAREGLGRGDSFSPTIDSYVRVQVSRLRKTLEACYERAPAPGGERVELPAGSYGLVLARARSVRAQEERPAYDLLAGNSPNKGSSTVSAGSQLSGTRKSHRSAFASGILATLGLGLIVAVTPGSQPDGSVVQGGLSEPAIAYSIETTANFDSMAGSDDILASTRREIADRIDGAIIARSAQDPSTSDYRIDVVLDAAGPDMPRFGLVLRDSNARVIRKVENALPGNASAAKALIGWEMAALVSPPGLIARDLVGSSEKEPANGFECFLHAELGRATGSRNGSAGPPCHLDYRESIYFPYGEARRLFAEIQGEFLREGQLSRESSQWRELNDLLITYPENSYLNTLASKLLYASQQCMEAKVHERVAFERGRDFPALELAILVERMQCEPSETQQAQDLERLNQIIAAQREPHALLEFYAIAALVLSGEAGRANEIPHRPMQYERDAPIVALAQNLRAVASSSDAEPAAALGALIWGKRPRELVFTSQAQD